MKKKKKMELLNLVDRVESKLPQPTIAPVAGNSAEL